MFKNILISLCIFMSVLVFVYRIYLHYFRQHFFSMKFMTKIGTFHFVFLLILYLKFFEETFFLWLCGISSLIILPSVFFIFLKIHQKQFHSEFVRFLSLTILSMQQGYGFTSAFQRILQTGNWKQRRVFQHIFDNVAFSQQEKLSYTGPFGVFIDEIREQFVEVKNNQHQGIERLFNFRKNLRDRLIFRQKSRQIWTFFLFQLGILSVIYVGIFIFVVHEYGFFEFKKQFLLSFLFYFCGVAVVIFLAKGKKWSI